MAREALGIVGGAIGFIYGGPAGAALGYNIGSAVGGALAGPTRVPAPGLAEAPLQTSRDGVPIPIIRGLHECHGNLIQKNPEVIVTTTERQGKGGGGTEVETKQRFRTYAIGIAEPFVEITRIWRNGKLVYDTRTAPAIPAAETAKYADKITIYLGDEAQLPDPELEAHWGADETPAYRGLGYIVHIDDDLTDTGGAIPSFRFELNGSRDLSITSEPYPADATDGLMPTITFPTGWLAEWPVEAVETECLPYAADWGADIVTEEYEEAIETECLPYAADWGYTIVTHELDEAIETECWPFEADWGAGLVSYAYEEAIETTCVPDSATLTT